MVFDFCLFFFFLCEGAEASAKQLRDDLITLLIAGHETTGSMLTWATWLLAQHPEAQAKMQKEIDEVRWLCGEAGATP